MFKMFNNFKNKFKKTNKIRKYKNILFELIVEACHSLEWLSKLIGVSVFTTKCIPGNIVITTFSRFGFGMFTLFILMYFYSVYEIFVDNQGIVQKYYNTKLQNYGESAERLATTAFVLYAFWKIPFGLSGRVEYAQLLIDIDKAIEGLGDHMDYTNLMYLPVVFLLFQATINITRILSVWLTILQVPVQKLFHMIYFDNVVFIMTSHYCTYLYMIHARYKKLNKILQDVQGKKCHELFMFRIRNQDITDNAVKLQEKYIAEKIRKCGVVYDLLYNATAMANTRFRMSMWVTLAVCLLFIVFYLYYLMEATASGLFHDPKRYIDFICFVSWQILFALMTIFLHIYFSESTVREAQKTSQIAHSIINSDFDPVVKAEALHLSLQVLHQTPIFAGCGLHKLDYELLLEGSRSVVTFLVIMLQFVTPDETQIT